MTTSFTSKALLLLIHMGGTQNRQLHNTAACKNLF